MISDGCVVQCLSRPDNGDIISLEIQSRDRYILEMFAIALGADKELVHDNQKRGHSYIRFTSNKMSEDLRKYGVVHRKSDKTFLPVIDESLMPHLIRGYFDGNGTFTYNNGYKRFAFYGSKRICTEIRDYLVDKIGIRKNKVSKSTCYHVWWSGDTQYKMFCNYIYDNCGDLYLERKKNKF